jgi:hypothetical protein
MRRRDGPLWCARKIQETAALMNISTVTALGVSNSANATDKAGREELGRIDTFSTR